MPRQHHHLHHEPPPPACCCACGGGCGGGGGGFPAPASCYCYYPAPPAPASASDHLLHAIAAHLLLGSASPAPATPPPQPHPQPQTQPPPPAAAHHAYPYPSKYQYQYQQPKPQPQTNPSEHSHVVLHSLLRRVAALESTLPHCFTSPPVPPPLRPNLRHRRVAAHQEEEEDDDDDDEEEDTPPSPPPRQRRARAPPSPARERAARTIQAHFRRFLARRSRTLRHLKELAILRSKAAALRGSLSGRGRVGDPAVISEAAMALLFHLDAIQGGDPMIREGKRAVSRELTRILEFADKVLVKEHGEIAKNGALDCNDYHEGCSGANKKKVSFCSNGKVQELHYEAVAEEEHCSDAEESSETSSSAEADERKRTYSKKSANGKPGLAAPAPVYMESRRIDGERR
ncbi:BAG family molecular chaperone regulator 8, chloroplastic [Oryza brachyantha]|uniref:BAG family molecular chaperone regulator 8, chloroplastic n=1 Tax=Oryza brachyantha TaxID=4533 RepID=UPI001ADAF762|nr:BAG family molecular chaperone regulator 8, chloroplastic [Oryza brachyantha]XP_040380126.1 BAG family molecular chaperone regulator 8, chloroplastic [Oryza brachyantha]